MGNSTGLDVNVEVSATSTVVTLSGELDLATAPSLDERLGALGAGDGPVVIDLTAVSFLDSSGLSVLVRNRQLLEAATPSRQLRVVASRPSTLRVFELTGLSEVLAIFPSLADATTS